MIKIMTAQEHHALYCQCGGMNEMDVEAVTVMRYIVNRQPPVEIDHSFEEEVIE